MPIPLPKATLSVAEFCRAAGVGRSLFYKQVQAERIRVVTCPSLA